ncbi:hypothetical protein BACI349Y_40132 [Bacillus sp. 349Y]|nr:hypothetical protein BACI349Y_40132 [Bacillus sp. 349Y]
MYDRMVHKTVLIVIILHSITSYIERRKMYEAHMFSNDRIDSSPLKFLQWGLFPKNDPCN